MSLSKAQLRIGVFDSGSGGLSILKEIRKEIPNASYDYLCDNLYWPYGELQSKTLTERILTLSERLLESKGISLLVVACNTASTVSLEILRAQLKIPVIGVVPAIKTAAEKTKTKHIGVIATKGTIESDYLAKLIEKFASDHKVTLKHSNELVKLSEQKVFGKSVALDLIKKELEPFFLQNSIDSIVLGCTHYSHLLEEFKAIQPRQINWIDTRTAIARRVKSLLEEKGLGRRENYSSEKKLCVFYTDKKTFSTEQKSYWKKVYGVDDFTLF